MSSIKASKFGLNSSENTSITIASNDLDMLISANGKEAIHIDSNARVGLGISEPTYKLDVGADTNNGIRSNNTVFVEGSSNSFVKFKAGGVVTGSVFADTNFGLSGSRNALFIINSSSQANIIFQNGPSYTERLRIDNFGRVGINTSSPTANLHVVGSIRDDVGDVRDIGINDQSASYLLLEADAGKVISLTTGNVFVPNAVFSAGQAVSVYNNSAASITITENSSVTMYLAGTATTGNRTLAQRGVATILCVAANTFVISGGGLT